ncbi:MAG: glycosyltransferase family 4 protein, partial [Bryobacteraceae bacterium]
FHFIPRVRYLIAEKIWPPAYLYTYKHQWQCAALEAAKSLHEQIHFDLVHQLTYVSFRVPGYLWQLDVPFVWGPIGGLEQTTWRLIPALGVRGAVHFGARNFLNDIDRRFASLPKLAFQKAEGGIIAATEGIRREIKRFYGCDSTVISEIGIPPLTRDAPVRREAAEPLRLLWCGEHRPRKALPFLLEALGALPADLDWRLDILGEGPCTRAWRRIAASQGVDGRCQWLGQLPRAEALRLMQRAHALMVTSVYDLTSTVLVEALANGLPVVCPDHCGFRDAITPECGVKVPATSPRELVKGLRDAIVQFADENFRFRLAQGAVARSAGYAWEKKAEMVNAIYMAKAGLDSGAAILDVAGFEPASGRAALRSAPTRRA